jgi:hypothetical protein
MYVYTLYVILPCEYTFGTTLVSAGAPCAPPCCSPEPSHSVQASTHNTPYPVLQATKCTTHALYTTAKPHQRLEHGVQHRLYLLYTSDLYHVLCIHKESFDLGGVVVSCAARWCSYTIHCAYAIHLRQASSVAVLEYNIHPDAYNVHTPYTKSANKSWLTSSK